MCMQYLWFLRSASCLSRLLLSMCMWSAWECCRTYMRTVWQTPGRGIDTLRLHPVVHDAGFSQFSEFDCSCTSQFHGYLNTLGSSVVFFKQSWRSLCNVVGSYQETTPPFGSSTAERSLIQFGGGLYSISHSNSRLKVRSVLMWWPYKREKPQWSLWVSACQGERKNIFYIKTRLRKE